MMEMGEPPLKIDEHDVMSINQTDKDGKDLCDDNDRSTSLSNWNSETSSFA